MRRRDVDNGDSSFRPVTASVKRRIPEMVPGHVERHRLVARLDAAGPEGVVVVHGPAGAGKTSLVAAWAATLDRVVSWCTLDERDRHFPGLLSNLVSAVDRIRPGELDCVFRRLQEGAGPDVIVDELVAALDGPHDEPATLVLDDFQLIADDFDVIGVFREVVRHLPPGLQLVVISRSSPALALDRARLEGKVTMIDFDDLRFSPSEAGQLLRRVAPDADDAWIGETTVRAAGWAAALQLFALADRGRTDPDSTVTAMQTAIDYLFAEAFREQPCELVELLFGIAIVGRVNAPLARALTGRDEAGDLLRRAFERDLFLSRRGEGWYELHPLVRALLSERMAEDPQRPHDLHALAALYFERDRDFEAALEHWALAGRHREALRLLTDVHLELYDAGRHDVVRHAIAAMPVDSYATDFAATMAFSWCQVLVDPDRFLTGLTRLTWWSRRTPVEGTLSGRLALLQSVGAIISGDWAEGGRLAQQAMDALGPDWILDPYGRFGFNVAARAVAMSERWHDDDHHVRRADLELAVDPVMRMSFEGIRALGEAIGGHPLAALQTASGVHRLAGVSNMKILREELRLAEAMARREIGDNEGVIETLEALADTEVASLTHVRLFAQSELVATHLTRAAFDDAQTVLLAMQQMVDHTTAGAGARSLLARCAADAALALDDVVGAQRCAGEIADAFWHPVISARTMLALSDRDAARLCLADAVPRCSRHDVVLGLWRAASTSDHEEALKHAAAAVEIAMANGMVHTVAAQGYAIVELVERCAWLAPAGWLTRVRTAAVSAPLHSVGLTAAESVKGHGGGHDPRAGGAEPLTERERDVLRFLPSRLTLQEIADELYISMNTLKFHLKVIYRKLGVGSRADAAEVARQRATGRTVREEREGRP